MNLSSLNAVFLFRSLLIAIGCLSGHHSDAQTPIPNLAILSSERFCPASNRGCFMHEDFSLGGYKYLRTNDGGAILNCGHVNRVTICTNPKSAGGLYKYFIGIDSLGNVKWVRCYDDVDTASINIQDIFPVAGNCFLETTTYGGNHWGARKTDASGKVLWSKRYNVTSQLNFSIPTPDGGVLMYGQPIGAGANSEVNIHYGATFVEDVFVFKIDSNGNKQWGKVLGGSYEDDLYKILTTPDGGYLLVGNTKSNDYDATGFHGTEVGKYADIWLVKLDANGTKEWHKCLGGSHIDDVLSAVCKGNGNAWYIFGETLSNDGDVQGAISNPKMIYNESLWLLKMDFDGNILWQKCHYNTDTITHRNPVYLTGLEADADGQLWASGIALENDGYLIDTLYNARYINDALVMRFDTFGNITGRRVMGSPQKDEAYFVLPLSRHVTLVGGNYWGPSSNNTLPPTSSTLPSIFLNRIGNWTTSVQNISKPIWFSLYPNPATATIQLKSATEGSVEIISSEGRMVRTIPLDGNTPTTVQVADLPRGLYIAKFISKTGGVLVKKLIIE